MWLVVSDLDHTWVDPDPEALEDLQKAVVSRRGELTLAYNTGRDLELYRQLAQEVGLLCPDYLIADVGTSLYRMPGGEPDPEWSRVLRPGWNRKKAAEVASRFPLLRPQPRQFPFKQSYHLTEGAPEVLAALSRELSEAGVEHRLIYSSGRDLDILPARAGKGEAVEFLRRRLGLPLDRVVVCGDSGNDLDMLDRPWCSVVVANAQPELARARLQPPTYRASRPASRGVLEGLQRFGVL